MSNRIAETTDGVFSVFIKRVKFTKSLLGGHKLGFLALLSIMMTDQLFLALNRKNIASILHRHPPDTKVLCLLGNQDLELLYSC